MTDPATPSLPPSPKNRPSVAFKSLASAESDFARVVQAFIRSAPPERRPFVYNICKTWAKAWSDMPAGLQPADRTGVSELARELCCSKWRDYYALNRESLLARRRSRYHRRRARQRQKKEQPPQTDA